MACSFCNDPAALPVDELGLCHGCAPTILHFIASTRRVIDGCGALFGPVAVFSTRLGKLKLFVRRLGLLQAVQDRGIAVGVPDLDALLRRASLARRDLVLAELDDLMRRTRRQVGLAATARLQYAVIARAAEQVWPLVHELGEPGLARPYLAELTRDIRAIHATAQRAGTEVLALKLLRGFAVERFRETLSAVKLTFQPDSDLLRQIGEFEATLDDLLSIGWPIAARPDGWDLGSGGPPTGDLAAQGQRRSAP